MVTLGYNENERKYSLDLTEGEYQALLIGHTLRAYKTSRDISGSFKISFDKDKRKV